MHCTHTSAAPARLSRAGFTSTACNVGGGFNVNLYLSNWRMSSPSCTLTGTTKGDSLGVYFGAGDATTSTCTSYPDTFDVSVSAVGIIEITEVILGWAVSAGAEAEQTGGRTGRAACASSHGAARRWRRGHAAVRP